jgi:hypothetical protein
MLDGLKYTLWLLMIVLLTGCPSHYQSDYYTSDNHRTADLQHEETYWKKVGSLQNDLAALSPQADLFEARKVAETAIGYSKFLAEDYDLVRPAVFHNILIRIGWKQRGLCYHWTEDLIERLQKLDLKTYQFHWGVAHRGSELREHNSVVITAKGQPFDTGMVLDPWRNSGDLYWSMVDTDNYPWRELPSEEW